MGVIWQLGVSIMFLSGVVAHHLYPSVGGELVFVGSYLRTFIGDNSEDISLTALTGGIGSAPIEGDIVVGAGCSGKDDTSMLPSGYTAVVDYITSVDGDNQTSLSIGYKVMGATPDTVMTLPNGSGGSLRAGAGIVSVWRNANTSSPFDPTPITTSVSNTVRSNPDPITPVANNSVVLVFGVGGHTEGGNVDYTSSDLTGFITDSESATTSDVIVGYGRVDATGSEINPALWGFSGTDSASFSCVSACVVINPT